MLLKNVLQSKDARYVIKNNISEDIGNNYYLLPNDTITKSEISIYPDED